MNSVIEVLGEKIKTLQKDLTNRDASLDAAVSQIEALRTEVFDLRDQGQNEINRHGRGGQEDVKSLALQYKVSHDQLEEKLQDALRRSEEIFAERTESDATHQSKMINFRQKYKLVKESNKELEKALQILQEDVGQLTQERDAAFAIGKLLEEKFDPAVFLSSSKDASRLAQPALSEIKSYSNDSNFYIPEMAQRLCAPGGTVAFDGNSIVWSTKGIDCGISVYPKHRFNPTSNAEWVDFRHNKGLRPGERRDLFYKFDGLWSYLGTYDCISEGVVDLDSLPLSERAKQGTYRGTAMHSDLVTPFLRKMIPSMYSAGILKVRCHTLRRTGFNRELYQTLLGLVGQPIQIPGQPPTKNKRRGTDGLDKGGSSKKSKTDIVV